MTGFDPCDIANQALEDLIATELAQSDSKPTSPPTPAADANHSQPAQAASRLMPPGFAPPALAQHSTGDSFSQRRECTEQCCVFEMSNVD